MKSQNDVTVDELLENIEKYVEHKIDEGERVIEVMSTKDTQKSNATSASKTVTSRTMDEVIKTISGCEKCSLSKTRNKIVPGQGNSHPDIMFIGEAPGADEDEQGLAFVGRAGKLLTKMIIAMGLDREEVFIGNILKCRPPDNRKPTAKEMEICMPYLKEQIAILKPKVIIGMGATAVTGLINPDETISKVRGKWVKFEGIDFMPTFHPAYLLRNPPMKKYVWEDLKAVLKHLGKKVPKA